MTYSVDPDQLASSEANWSGSTLFAKAGYIQVQQDNGIKVNVHSWKDFAAILQRETAFAYNKLPP